MSFSRRLTVALQEFPATTPKHNQVLVEHVIYQRLLDIANGSLIILRVTVDNDDAPADVLEKEFFVTVVGEHAQRADVLVSQELINFFGQPIQGTRFRFTFVKKMPELTSVTIKFLENDFCFLDPREAVQGYLEDYHILYEGMLMQIPSQIDDMMGLIRIESLAPAIVCRVPNGEVELEIVNDGPAVAPEPDLQPPVAETTPQPQPEPTPQPEAKPFNFNEMLRDLFPSLAMPEQTTHRPPPQERQLTKEEVRAARIAFFTKKNE
jgi:hypothetical protein